MPFSRVAVVGSREFSDHNKVILVLNQLLQINGPFVVVSGAAEGPDTWAAEWARTNGMEVVEYPADWSTGKDAGTKRNKLIVDDSEALIAFWDGESTGTVDSIHKARRSKKSVQVILA